MKFETAKVDDIDGVLLLHSKYQIDTILEEDKKDGFVTTSFTKEQMVKLIEDENGLFVAKLCLLIYSHITARLKFLTEVIFIPKHFGCNK
jgi:hypothetical protein